MSAFARWRRHRRGSVALEFALIFPMLLLLGAGTIEAALMLITDATMELAIRSASRYAITGAGGASRVDNITKMVEDIAGRWKGPDGKLSVEMRAYTSFENIGKPEPFTDLNGNNAWDVGEKYEDVNDNDKWDPDMARSDAGGSGDIVIYTVTLTRPGFTGVLGLIGVKQLTFVRQTAVENE